MVVGTVVRLHSATRQAQRISGQTSPFAFVGSTYSGLGPGTLVSENREERDGRGEDSPAKAWKGYGGVI